MQKYSEIDVWNSSYPSESYLQKKGKILHISWNWNKLHVSKTGTYKLKCSTHKNNFGEFLPRYLKTSEVRKIDSVQDDSHLGLPTRFSDLDSKTGAP